MSSTTDKAVDTGFFGQPRPLATLFGVELWERFSFYGMQGILLIYLYYSVADGGLGIPKATAAGIGGAYGGGVYLATILGAWVADRLVSAQKVLLASASVVMLGHIALALLPGLAGVGVGLILIALGSGGLKATATSLVGSLYDEGDPRRDAGFSLYYLGINLGAFFGPILTGLLQSGIGFHFGFGLAALQQARQDRACCRAASASTSASAWPRSGWPPASSSTPWADGACRRPRRSSPTRSPHRRDPASR